MRSPPPNAPLPLADMVTPGPYSLRLPLSFSQMKSLEHYAFQKSGLIENRIPAIREIGRLGHRVDEWLDTSRDLFLKRIQKLPQIGVWTANVSLALSHGDPDAVVLGDYSIPHTVSWALTRVARSNDKKMVELLKPFEGNRWRLVRLLWGRNIPAPRRGPRLSSTHTRR